VLSDHALAVERKITARIARFRDQIRQNSIVIVAVLVVGSRTNLTAACGAGIVDREPVVEQGMLAAPTAASGWENSRGEMVHVAATVTLTDKADRTVAPAAGETIAHANRIAMTCHEPKRAFIEGGFKDAQRGFKYPSHLHTIVAVSE
jgi:hypothetical protein